MNTDHTQFLERTNILSLSDYVKVWAVFIDLSAYNAYIIYTVDTAVVLLELKLSFFRDNYTRGFERAKIWRLACIS
jgi:hypothetical protein